MQSEYEKFYINLYGTFRKIPKNLEKNIDDAFIEVGKTLEKRYRSKKYGERAFSSVCYLYGFNNHPKKEVSEIIEVLEDFDESNIRYYDRFTRNRIYESPYLSNIVNYGKKKADYWQLHPEEQKFKEMHIRDFFKEGRLGNPLLEFCYPLRACYLTDLPYAIEQQRIELSKGLDFELSTIEALRKYDRMYPKLIAEIIEKLNEAGIEIINHDVKTIDATIKENPELSNKKKSYSFSLTPGDRKKLSELAEKNEMRVNEYLGKLIREEYGKVK